MNGGLRRAAALQGGAVRGSRDPALGRPQVSRDSGETCGPAKRRGRETRAERGSPTARRQRADAQRLDSGEMRAAGEFSAIAVWRPWSAV